MAGKAPLLLAVVLLLVGAVGLGLTTVDQATFGPFQPHAKPLPKTETLVLSAGDATSTPPPLYELTTPLATEELVMGTVPLQARRNYVAAPQATESPAEPEPSPSPPPPPPLRVFGISSDDGGVSAAAATPPPPPPVRIGGIAFDEEPATETPAPEPEATPEPD